MPFKAIIGHAQPLRFLQAALKSGRLGHALLFHGEDRIGKRLVAKVLAQAINCEAAPPLSPPDACGTCRSCHQIDIGSHPDVTIIQATSGKGETDQTREIESRFIYRPLVGSRKIVILDNADLLRQEAANALLKTIEEPPPDSLIILVSAYPECLLPTIRSRCQELRFAPLPIGLVKDLLIRQRRLSDSDARFLSVVSGGRVGLALEANIDDLRAQRAGLLESFGGRTASRREFFKLVGGATALAIIEQVLPLSAMKAWAAETGGKLEKTDLKVGFIPITCATPLIMAEPLGIYKKHGLNVEEVAKTVRIRRSIRDFALNKQTDATHMLTPMPLYFDGSGVAIRSFLMPAVENINGQAITCRMKHKGVKTAQDGRRISSPCPSTIRCITFCSGTFWRKAASILTRTCRSGYCRLPRWWRTCARTIWTATSVRMPSTSARCSRDSGLFICSRKTSGTDIRAALSRVRKNLRLLHRTPSRRCSRPSLIRLSTPTTRPIGSRLRRRSPPKTI